MAIGAGWAEGSWIDASWVVGAWNQSAENPTGGISKRKKKHNQEEYNKAYEAALTRRDRERKEITASVEQARKQKTKVLKVKDSPLTEPEIKQIAGIDDEVNRLLAIEFQINQLEFKRRENEALAILLLA